MYCSSKIKFFLVFLSLSFTMMAKAQSVTMPEKLKDSPFMLNYYKAGVAINDYLKTQNTESLESALVLLNPKKMNVAAFAPDEIVDESGLIASEGHFVYDYDYAMAIYEDKEIPKEFGLQRDAESEIKVALITLKPQGKVVYRVAACDLVKMFTLCEPDGKLLLEVKELSSGKCHVGEEHDNGTVSAAMWSMDDDMLEIQITNVSEKATSAVFVTN